MDWAFCFAENNAGKRIHCQDSNSISGKASRPVGFRERESGVLFASRFHLFASIILSAAEISSKVGAFHRRTAPSLALAR
jgi:hypothetical protein